MTSKRH